MKTGSYVSNILPSAADANKYFYLPALGYYGSGQLNLVGSNGQYWSSSASPLGSNYAYYLRFHSGNVDVGRNRRYGVFKVGGFE